MTPDMPPWVEKFIDKTIQILQNDTLKKKDTNTCVTTFYTVFY